MVPNLMASNAIASHEDQHLGMAGQTEQALRKGAGSDFGQCRDAGTPSPFADPEQRRLMTPGDRCFGARRFEVMVELVRDEEVLDRGFAKQARGRRAGESLRKRSESARIEQ